MVAHLQRPVFPGLGAMIIESVVIYRYRLPFRTPWTFAGRQLTHRTGLVLELRDEAGHRGWGEAAPFPGLNRENLSGVLYQLHSLARKIKGQRISLRFPLAAEGLESLLTQLSGNDRTLFPTVAFAMESALVQLCAASAGIPLPQVYSQHPANQVCLNAVLSGSPEEILKQARYRIAEGYTVLKVKVGRGEPQAEQAMLRQLAEKLPAGGKLRLDANRAWRSEEALRWLEPLCHLPIEYVEEPLQRPGELPAFLDQSPVPVALDESLAHPPVFQHPRIAAHVLKPGVIAGLSRTLEMIQEARQHRILPVISSPFYSGVGLTHLLALAAGAVPAHVVHGLDTARYLAEDVLQPAGLFRGPRLRIELLKTNTRLTGVEKIFQL